LTRLEFVDKVFKEKNNFVPTVSPACADFACTMLKTYGGACIPKITYVPDFFKYYYETNDPQPGDLIIFDQTYDAVAPAGIGPEDDMTHVGIVDRTVNGITSGFFHYSNSQGRVAWDTWTSSYWVRFPHKFLRTHVGDEPAPADRYLKIFYNGGKLTIVVDGKEYQPKSMEGWVKF